jgi:transcriptional regulator with XRE-family HTH domain
MALTTIEATGGMVDMSAGIEAFRVRVETERKRRGWSKRTLASRAGLSHGTVQKFMAGDTKRGNADTMLKIATALEMNVDQFLGRELRLPESSTMRVAPVADAEPDERQAAAEFARANRLPEWAIRRTLEDPELAGISLTPEEWYAEMRVRAARRRRRSL